jgi:hypothetical protein
VKPKWLTLTGAIIGVALVLIGVRPDRVETVELTYAYSPDFAPLIEPLIAAYNDRGLLVGGQRVVVHGVSISSGDARTDLVNGQLTATLWTPASSVWGELVLADATAAARPVGAGVSLASSPQVIAMWRDCAAEIGWSPTHQPSWDDVIALTQTHGRRTTHCREFTLAATYPDRSTSGLFAVASWYAMATGQTELSLDQLHGNRDATRQVAAIEHLPVGYGVTSVGVMNHMCADTSPHVEAVYLQENTLVSNNDPSCLRKRDAAGMVAVYPSGGTYIADYPLYVMAGTNTTSVDRAAALSFRSWVTKAITPAIAGAAGFRTADGVAVGIVDEEHGAIPELPDAAQILPSLTPDVARWLQVQWWVACGVTCVRELT